MAEKKASELTEAQRLRIAQEVIAAFAFHEPALADAALMQATEAVLTDPAVDDVIPAFPLTPAGTVWLIGNIETIVGEVARRLEADVAGAGSDDAPSPAAPPDPVLSAEETPDAAYHPDFRKVPRG